MKKNKIIHAVCILMFTTIVAQNVQAQEDRSKSIIRQALIGLEYEVKAGFSIGGTSPLPLPAEIRAIESYNPTIQIAIEGNVTKWINKQWGVQLGLRLENKGMKTDARVKNYNMEMVGKDQGHMKGAWTGNVKTKVHNSYVTIPVLATYKLTSRWILKGGLFASYMSDGEFSGSAYNGYLRDENPIGEKVNVSEATYDFSDELRHFSWGAQLSGEWKAFKHLNVFADLTWGLNDIFKKDFNTITFAMYPIYLNVGFGYSF